MEILTGIINLDMARIRYYLKDLRCTRGIREEYIAVLESRMAAFGTLSNHSLLKSFLEWIANALAVRDLPQEPSAESLVGYIQWALEGKRTYLECLEAAYSTDGQRWPHWVYTVLKLARYAIASKALLQLASELPSLFNPMLIEPVTAPKKTQFIMKDGEMPLTSVLRRLGGGREADYTARLTSVWSVADAETHFRNACALSLPVHAEMQLLNFYDHNPDRRPTFRFIGVSKKTCFLCQRFLANYPRTLSVSSRHQKLYPSWRPPPSTEAKIYRQYKTITTELSKLMEATAKQELETRLGLHRPFPRIHRQAYLSLGYPSSVQ